MADFPPTDDALLRQFTHHGDRTALDAVVRRHIDFVYGVARRQMRGDASGAEDVTQAVFLVLTTKARAVPPGRLGGWLFRTTCYAAANARKSSARRVYYERRTPPAEPTMPADSDEADPLLPLLDDALAALNRTDREAIILRYLQGRELADVAAALGASESAARRRLSRAVEKLRDIFTARGVRKPGPAGTAVAVTLTIAPPAPAAVVAQVTAVVANTAAASASAVSITQGVMTMLTWTKAKTAAGVVVAAALLTTAGVGVVRYAWADTPVVASTPPAAGATSESTTAPAATPTAVPAPVVGTFGPVREVLIATTGLADRLFDLDTAALRPLAGGINLRSADLPLDTALGDADVTGPDANGNDSSLLWARVDFVTTSPVWDEITPADIAVAPKRDFTKLWGLRTGIAYGFWTKDGVPSQYDGSHGGRLMVVGREKDGRVRLRYQMIGDVWTREFESPPDENILRDTGGGHFRLLRPQNSSFILTFDGDRADREFRVCGITQDGRAIFAWHFKGVQTPKQAQLVFQWEELKDARLKTVYVDSRPAANK